MTSYTLDTGSRTFSSIIFLSRYIGDIKIRFFLRYILSSFHAFFLQFNPFSLVRPLSDEFPILLRHRLFLDVHKRHKLSFVRWIGSIHGASLKYEYSKTYTADFLPLSRGLFVGDFTLHELVNKRLCGKTKQRKVVDISKNQL